VVVVIPVKPQLAPKGFNRKVLRPGRKCIADRGLPKKGSIPKGRTKELKPYWRRCLKALHRKYDGVCAYLCIYIEVPVKGHSVDHFVPKSLDVALACRWSNYRLASLGLNARKRDFTDVLDPFTIAPDTFHINFSNGKIYPNPSLPSGVRIKGQATIKRLDLDSYECREMRRGHFDEYNLRGMPLVILARRSPFVWREIIRQGL
jgi:hypothetical protein